MYPGVLADRRLGRLIDNDLVVQCDRPSPGGRLSTPFGPRLSGRCHRLRDWDGAVPGVQESAERLREAVPGLLNHDRECAGTAADAVTGPRTPSPACPQASVGGSDLSSFGLESYV